MGLVNKITTAYEAYNTGKEYLNDVKVEILDNIKENSKKIKINSTRKFKISYEEYKESFEEDDYIDTSLHLKLLTNEISKEIYELNRTSKYNKIKEAINAVENNKLSYRKFIETVHSIERKIYAR